MDKLFKDLEYAKEAVAWLLKNGNGSVDFHNIVYWAERVDSLRKEIKGMI